MNSRLLLRPCGFSLSNWVVQHASLVNKRCFKCTRLLEFAICSLTMKLVCEMLWSARLKCTASSRLFVGEHCWLMITKSYLEFVWCSIQLEVTLPSNLTSFILIIAFMFSCWPLITLQLQDGHIVTDIYANPTNGKFYLPFSSSHSFIVKSHPFWCCA